jgi:ubiquinone/menaquinone biosynthesis C-methylase UbiE
VTRDRRDDLAAIRSLYDRIANRYDRSLDGRFLRWVLRDSRSTAASHARGRLLEIGIGSGASLPFYGAGVDVTGIDLSPGMLALAERRLAALGRPGTLRVMDAQQLDFPDHAFDSVAFNLVLCTVPDPSRALREAVRVARPGSPMTFVEHVRSNRAWVAVPQDFVDALIGRAIHDKVNLDTEKLIRKAGIEVLSSERWLLGAMTLVVGRAP